MLRRPHLHLVGADLVFLISNRSLIALSETEQQIWADAEQPLTVAELVARHGADAASRVARLAMLGVIDLAEPAPTGARRRIMVIEPHSDDAVLSVGGTMWARRHDVEFTIVTVFSRSIYTSYFHSARDYFDVETVTALRRAESERVARLLHAQHRDLDLQDATLRHRDDSWDRDRFLANRPAVSASNNRRPSRAEFERVRQVIQQVLLSCDADEVWSPMAVGSHSDHHLARDACLATLVEHPELLSRYTVRLYQDTPYDGQFPGHAPAIVLQLRSWGATLESEDVPIDDLLDDKLRLVSVYASQFKADAVRKGIELSGATGQSPGLHEHLWRLAVVPREVNPEALTVDRADVARSTAGLRRMLPSIRRRGSLRLLLLVPSGRWAEDIDEVLDIFPELKVEVFASGAALAEAEAHKPAGVDFRPLVDGSRRWATLALRLGVGRAVPTVFVAGTERRTQAEQLAHTWVRFPHLVVPSMDHFLRALRDAHAAEALT